MKAFTATILLFLLAISVVGQKSDSDDGTIFAGRNFSFALKDPAGWVMDSEVARSQDLEAVLYPTGSSWKESVVVMYARVIVKTKKQATIQQVIANDIEEFMKLSRDSTVGDSPALETRDKKKGISKLFYDAANKNHECVTFIDEPKVVVILAISSRNKNEFEKALPAFKALVGSYFFFEPLAAP